MGEIDLSSMQEPMNEMVMRLVIFILVPFVCTMIVNEKTY